MVNTLPLLILFLAILLLVLLSYKGLGQVIAPFICVAIVSLIAKSGFVNAFFTLFPKGAGSFIVKMLLPVISGAVLGEIMSASGAGRSIGQYITHKLGKDNAPYIIMITSFIVALSGMNSAMFAIAALSHVVMKEANLPSYIGMISFLGFKELTSAALPGLPHSGNLLPTTYLGTDLYAGTVPGIISLLFGWTLIVLYVRYLVKQARRENKGYENFFKIENAKKELEGVLPSFTVSVIPFLCVLILTYILQKGFGISAVVAAFSTQAFAIVLMIILCRKTFLVAKTDALMAGVRRGAEFLLSAACLVGFASVVTDTVIFDSLQIFLANLKMNPYIFTFVAVSLFAAIACDPNSAIVMFFQTFAGNFINNPAINLGFLHRIATITSIGFDSLPQGGMTLLTLKTFGYDHKSGYKYLCVASLVIPFLSAFMCASISALLG